MMDNNYSVDEILQELREKGQLSPQKSFRTFDSYTDEEKRLLGKALEHNRRSHFSSTSSPETPSKETAVSSPAKEHFSHSESPVWEGIFEEMESSRPYDSHPPIWAESQSVEEDDFGDGFEHRLFEQTRQAANIPLKQEAFSEEMDKKPSAPPPSYRESKTKRDAHSQRIPDKPTQKHAKGLSPGTGVYLQQMRHKLLLRLMVNFLAASVVLYLSIAPQYTLPLPMELNPGTDPAVYLWVMVGTLIVSALISGNAVGGGMLSLFTFRPNNDSYTALGIFACLVQGTYLALSIDLYQNYSINLYLPMGALILLFNTLGKLLMLGRVDQTYRLAAQSDSKGTAGIVEDHQLARRLGRRIIEEDETVVAYVTCTQTVEGYMDQAFSESKAENISQVVAPMTALAAVVMAQVSYFFNGDIFVAVSVFTAALCMTYPLIGVIAANLPLSRITSKLVRSKAAICGYGAVADFGRVNGIILRGGDLFSPTAITLHSVKAFNKSSVEDVILDAASVLAICDSTLTSIFKEMVPNEINLRPVESLNYEDGMGISAWVRGRRVLIGNRALMKSYGVQIPSMEFETRQAEGDKEILYLSNSGEVAAMYILSYRAEKSARRMMQLLYRKDIAVCLYALDPCLTAQKIAQVFDFPEDLVEIIPASLHPQIEQLLAPKESQPAGIIHDGAPVSCIRTIAAAQSCSSILSAETALILLSVIIGFAIVTFFAFSRTMPTLTWIIVAIYQLLWGVLQLMIPLLHRG